MKLFILKIMNFLFFNGLVLVLLGLFLCLWFWIKFYGGLFDLRNYNVEMKKYNEEMRKLENEKQMWYE